MIDLQECRKEIDVIDKEILRLFEKRMKVCEDVAEYKIHTGKQVLDPKREQDKLDVLKNQAHGSFNSLGAQELFQQIMAISRKRQYQLLTKNGVGTERNYKMVDELPLKDVNVVFQGVEGAYSYAAMRAYFPEEINSYHVKTFRAAMEEVAFGKADYAVLPIENSTEGIVTDIYDLLTEYQLYIVGEQGVRVQHVLLGLPGVTVDEIDTVYSHPQALAQCKHYLEEHPSWKTVKAENTAASAKRIKEEQKRNQAAIASRAAGELYGLSILAENICHNDQNVTRFIIVSSKPIYEKNAGKISVCFELPHASGTLYHMLSHFIYNSLSMTKIESRPIPGQNWKYRFFVDFEGNLEDPAVKNALRGLEAEAIGVRVLGNYGQQEEIKMTRVKECVLYRGFEHGEILDKMTALMDACEKSAVNAKEMEEDFYECVNGLIETAGSYGFAGNLWHNYLTLLLVNNENAFSTASEIRGHIDGSINELALHDFAIFKELYDFDLNLLDKVFHTSCCGILCDYQAPKDSGKMFNKRIRDRICEMSRTLAAAKDTKEFMEDMVQFYKDFGVGKLGLHKAFRIEKDENGKAQIVPITRIAHVRLDDLVGYEIPKQKLIENTEAFVRGRKANNCLLFGDAGTGKSSSIKGILNQYYDEGLRIIEAYKHQFQDLNEIIAQIKDRNYKFIIYMDDLSFEEFEIEYKYLKAVIEGGLERKPDNILIYATSNRRHLVRERAGDKLEVGDSDDIHSSDTVQEKLSLVYRFGVRIYFGAPDRKEFHTIVKTLAARHGIQMPEDQLLAEAGKWEISHGGLTGRTAQQFIDHLLGKEEN